MQINVIYTVCNKIRPLISAINTPEISEELTSGGIHNGQLSMGLSGTGTSSVNIQITNCFHYSTKCDRICEKGSYSLSRFLSLIDHNF